MHKRKFTSPKWTAKMLAVTTPALLPLVALANPADGRGGSRVSPPRAVAAPAHNMAANQAENVGASRGVSTLVPVVGTVALPDGKPAPHALVYLTWMQNNGPQFHTCAADANGKFETTVTPVGKGNVFITSALIVTALAPGKGMAWTQIAVPSPASAKLQLNLMPLTTLAGRLLNVDGTPNAHTEVHVQVLHPRTTIRNGKRADAPEENPVTTTTTRRSVMGQSNNFTILPLLPPDALASQFRATTDANGKFTLNGVPRDTMIALKPGGKLAMAAGSANMIAVQDRDLQSAGVFVATQTGRVKVRVTDPVTHQPLPQIAVTLSNADARQNIALMRQTGARNFFYMQTNAQGEIVSPDLLPGDYQINVLGCVKTARVEPGHDAAPLEIAVRHGLLKGRLLDADGKPIANGEVRLATSSSNNGQAIVINGFGGNTFEFVNDLSGISNNVFAFQNGLNANVFLSRALPSMTIRAGADGTFMIPNMPWGSPNIRLWSAQGNDLAEWSGPASKVDANLTLKLRRNALVAVSGRLVNPDRSPVANMTCKALHWLATPRSTWFATARDVKTDANGNFKVEGLERGESFSLITVGQGRSDVIRLQNLSAVTLAQPGGVQNALDTLGKPRLLTEVAVAPVRQDFESPRFMTCATGDGQSLGDVMVHPQETPEQVLQSYEGSPGDQPSLPGIVLAPAPADVQAAQTALARFDSALQAGDMNVLTELTSRVSPGWSRNRQAFLQHVSLCGRINTDANATNTVAWNFVPRREIAMLVQAAPAEAGMERAERLAEEANNTADWVFLHRKMGDNVVLAGVLHREDGAWRVVANPLFSNPGAVQTASGISDVKGRWGQAANSLTPELQLEAEQAGERYLQAWLNADREQMRRLTSPFASLPVGNLTQFRHALERRADDGVCPLASEEKIALQPFDRMTLWDQDFLKQLAGMNTQRNLEQVVLQRGRNGNVINVQAVFAAPELTPAPETLAPGNDTAVFRYSAQGHPFLMILTRDNGRWQMLEPAMPL